MYIPKRLVEAKLGAAVSRICPEADLWAPTFHTDDGFGVANRRAGGLLFQCSAAEHRAAGPSTRIRRKQLDTYVRHPALQPWAAVVRFVLVGSVGRAHARSDLLNADMAGQISLLTIGLRDLATFIDQQGRGTINADALLYLAASASGAGRDTAAMPLEDTLLELRQGRIAPPTLESGCSPQASVSQPADLDTGSFFLAFDRPTPLGVGIPGRGLPDLVEDSRAAL